MARRYHLAGANGEWANTARLSERVVIDPSGDVAQQGLDHLAPLTGLGIDHAIVQLDRFWEPGAVERLADIVAALAPIVIRADRSARITKGVAFSRHALDEERAHTPRFAPMTSQAAATPPEIVVFWARRKATCDECREQLAPGSPIRLAGEVALCLSCADLDHLVFLGRGDAALTRRARKHSGLSAVVVQWSPARKRYERQGLLVEVEALERAEAECLSDTDRREARRLRAAASRGLEDERYVAEFADAIRRHFPHCAEDAPYAIARRACARHSGRVGRTAAAKAFSEDAIDLAVRAHVRHLHTPYDDYLMQGWDRGVAREAVRPIVNDVVASWRSGRSGSDVHDR